MKTMSSTTKWIIASLSLIDAIDAQFKSDASLSEFDQFHKHYKINHFLESQGIK